MTLSRTLVRVCAACFVLAAASQASVTRAAEASTEVELDVAKNPATELDASRFTRVRFEDYVSNPPPRRADAVSGWVAKPDSPFMGLVKPSDAYTGVTPLPEPVGVVLEGSGSTVNFFDNTDVADVSDPRTPVTVRFVDPSQPEQAAAVSHVSLRVTGSLVPEGGVVAVFFDAEGSELGAATVSADPPQRPWAGRVDVVARGAHGAVSAIHRIELRNTGGGYAILGAGMEVDRYDLAFAGLRSTSAAVEHKPAPRYHDQQWANTDNPIMITDLSVVEPQSAVSTTRRERGKWRSFEYETADFAGKTLNVTGMTDAPTVTLDLDREGWHAVYIGLGTIMNLGGVLPNRVSVKFTGDRTFAHMSNQFELASPRRDVLEEVFFRAADLTGQDLQFAYLHAPAAIAYVKLIPLTDEEVEAIKRDRANDETQRLVATFDGHGWLHRQHPETRQDLANFFTRFAYSDFGTWWFQAGGADITNYPTEVGNYFGTVDGRTPDDYARPGVDDVVTQSITRLREKGINPLRVAIEEAHRQDAEILLFSRVGGWSGTIPWEETFRSDFFMEHLEWRAIDRDGTPTMYLSYAVEEVQDHVVELLREGVRMGADGAGVMFHRGMPSILWEPAFVSRFENRFGKDPRELPEDDPRVYEMRAEIMTQYMTKIRRMLDEEQARRGDGKRLKLAATTFSTEADNTKWGLDIETWADRGLIDQLGIAWFAYHTSGLRSQEQDIDYYLDATSGGDVEVYPFLIGWRLDSRDYVLDTATEFYEHDIPGIAVWDPDPTRTYRNAPGNTWPILSRLGHVEELRSGQLNIRPRTIPLTRYGLNHYSRWFPNTGW